MSATLNQVAEGGLRMSVFDASPAPSDAAIQTYVSAAIIFGVAIAMGFRTRIFAAAAVLLNVSVMLWEQQTYTNHGWLLTLLLAVLVFADTERGQPSAAPTGSRMPAAPWPQLLMMSQLSVCYLFAGLSKVNGDFLSGDQFKDWFWWELPSEINLAIAWATVGAELFLAVGFWFTRTRVLAMLTGICLHGSITVMMRDVTAPLITFGLICLSIYPLFFAVRVNESTPPRTIIWDSHCSFCRRWVAVLRRVDVLRLHQFVGSDEPGAFEDPRITPNLAERAIQLLTARRHSQGFDAVRRVLAVSPLTFWISPLLWLPPINRLGHRLYERTAARRTCKIG